MKPFLRVSHVAAAILIALGAQAHAGATMELERAEARQLYEDGRWSLAWERFAALADEGDVESAQMVIRMTRFGEQLFQQAWVPASERMARWKGVATGQAVRTAVKN